MTPETYLHILQAKDEIRDLMARYCRAIDRLDADLLASVYHAGATEDHGYDSSDASAAQFQSSIIPYLRAKFVSTQHVLGSVHIELTGDSAVSESYVTAYHVRAPDESGVAHLDVIGARYVDRVERRGDQWRIAQRVAVWDWQGSGVAKLDSPPGQSGRRDQSDPIYLMRAAAAPSLE